VLEAKYVQKRLNEFKEMQPFEVNDPQDDMESVDTNDITPTKDAFV